MAEDAEMKYLVTRHASIKGDDDVLWVSVARWVYGDGTTQWCLEYWDDVGETDHDLDVDDEAAAIRRARDEFGIEESDWCPGPQPWGRPD